MESNNNIPKIVFIVPYRNRYYTRIHFSVYMKYLMEDYNKNDYEIYYSQQCDNRHFNRGAIKNIGFIAIKNKYPNDYKNITFVFNDVDTIPLEKNILKYETDIGEIKHFYGFDFALGGIFTIKGYDFERINGFPNYWGWGLEDNHIQNRALNANIKINRDCFYSYYKKNIPILQCDNDKNKLTTTKIRSYNNSKNDGLISLILLKYKIEGDFINIYNFDSSIIPYYKERFINRDMILEGNKLKSQSRYAGSMKMQLGIK